jgi:O-acetylhomoserine/O-acetylserine sulfhydrylase-like pyridoxal-dependent enzyme
MGGMSEQDRSWGFRTRAVHAGHVPDIATGARAVPIYQSTSFVFEDTTDAASLFALQKYGLIYSAAQADVDHRWVRSWTSQLVCPRGDPAIG